MRKDLIESQIARHQRAIYDLENMLDTLDIVENRPEDDFDHGAVICFEKTFPRGDDPTKVYSYAAIKSGDLWCTTGPKSPKYYTWEQLLQFIGTNTIWVVTDLEELV